MKQIIVQLHFMIILFMLGAGTTIQGMDVATFTRNIGECVQCNDMYILG